MNRFGYGHILTLITLVLLVPGSVEAQTSGSSVTMKATVSEVVTLSTAPNSIQGDVDVVSSGNAVRLTFSGHSAGAAMVRVPLIVRSNTNFKISARFESETARLTELSVTDVRATGGLVSPAAVNNLEINSVENFDLSPFVVVSGPRVSTGGTLNSANNALQITVLIRVKPDSVRTWQAHLTFFNN